MHDQGGTTAVLSGCRETILNYEAPILVEAALLAGNGDIVNDRRNSQMNRGISSGILNALLSCCCVEDNMHSANNRSSVASRYRTMAIELMQAYDDVGKKQRNGSFEPDLVSLCLAYTATTTTTASNSKTRDAADKDDPVAENFLRRAEQFYQTSPFESKLHTTKPGPVDGSSPNWLELDQLYGIQVLKDDEEFVVVSKPSGMVCYHGESSPTSNGGETKRKQPRRRTKQSDSSGRGDYYSDDDDDKSLEECLLDYGLPLSTLNKEGRGLVHRIDRGTSGCLILAKTNRMHAILLAQFFLRRLKKSYQALVCCSDSQQALLKPAGRNKISLDIDGRPATSKYTVEKRIGKYLTRLRVETEQGRRHQVRIHCSQGLKAPILLDPLYGGQSILSTLLKHSRRHREGGANGENENTTDSTSILLRQARSSQKFFLHADSLRIDAVNIDVQAPLPDWWQQLEEELQ